MAERKKRIEDHNNECEELGFNKVTPLVHAAQKHERVVESESSIPEITGLELPPPKDRTIN